MSQSATIITKPIARQIVGIDVAANELVCRFGKIHTDLGTGLSGSKTFSNHKEGFKQLTEWAGKLASDTAPVRYVMEATGVYHEALACHLTAKGLSCTIVLPNKICSFARTLDIKTVTDHTAADAITRFGLSRELADWQPPAAVFRELRQLTRERDQVVCERTVAKNQLHAEKAGAHPNKSSVARIEARISLYDTQEAAIRKEITGLVKGDERVRHMVELMCSIPAVGELTAATVIAETAGFDLIQSRRQLCSYAGLDVRQKQSGTSVNGKPAISKRGNRYLRKCLYMPALSAIRANEEMKATFVRLVGRHGIKLKAAVAVQRKMLELMYTLVKNDCRYDSSYEENRNRAGQDERVGKEEGVAIDNPSQAGKAALEIQK